jgi:hypothetical protein
VGFGTGDGNRTQLLSIGISTVSLKASAECLAQLGRKTAPLRHLIREPWRVRPTDSTELMVGAVGIELKARLKPRKSLILLNEKNTKNTEFTQVRYTPGTQRRQQKALSGSARWYRQVSQRPMVDFAKKGWCCGLPRKSRQSVRRGSLRAHCMAPCGHVSCFGWNLCFSRSILLSRSVEDSHATFAALSRRFASRHHIRIPRARPIAKTHGRSADGLGGSSQIRLCHGDQNRSLMAAARRPHACHSRLVPGVRI